MAVFIFMLIILFPFLWIGFLILYAFWYVMFGD